MGETSTVYETSATTASIDDSSIATMSFTPAQGSPGSGGGLTTYCWEFEKYSSGYYIKTIVNGTTMYLDPTTFSLVTNPTAIMVVSRSANTFNIRRGNRYIEYVNNRFQSRNGVSNHSSLELYRPTSDPTKYSTEFPGYEKLTDVGEGGNILIVVRLDNGFVCLDPAHIAQGTSITGGTYTPGSVSFIGVSSGTTHATVGDDTYTINVYSALEDKITVDKDSHTSVYYSNNFGSLSQASNNEIVVFNRLSTESKVYNFFGVPESGYALVKINNNMTVVNNNTAGDIRNDIATNYIQSQYSTGTGNTKEQVASHIGTANGNGAEGVNGYVVPINTNSGITETMIFRSEKLPTMDLKIYSIDGNLYSDGMTARSGSTVIYEVTVDKDEAGEFLNIENGVLSSSIAGATYIGTSPDGNSDPNNINISAGNIFNEKYYFSLVVPNGVTSLSNTVTMDYKTYSSQSDMSNNVSYKTDRQLQDSVNLTVDDKSIITIRNNVFGNMANKDKYFKYKVFIDGPVGDEFNIVGQDTNINYDGQSITTSSTFVSGQDNYIYIKDGQEVSITIDNNLVNYVGKTIRIGQVDGIEYETTINGNSGKTTGNIEFNNYTAAFVNYKEKSPNTGMFVDIKPFILLFGIVICGFLIVRKK